MRLLSHVKRHSVGYVALFCALTGTGWAASSLPRPGASHPHASIAAAPRSYVLAWAHVNANGRVVSGSPGATAYATGAATAHAQKSTDYVVHWRGLKAFGRCVPMVTLGQSVFSSAATANASIERGGVGRRSIADQVFVVTSNSQGQGVSTPFFVAVIC